MKIASALLTVGLGAATLSASSRMGAQVVNPAEARMDEAKPEPREPATGETKRGEEAPRAASTERLRSWELPPVTVVGEPLPELREEERVGAYGQPRWTATRRFPTTRVYVVPEGKVEFEFWARPTIEKDDPVATRLLWELEFGLPHRLQLDLYFRTDQEGDSSEMLMGQQVELRWALADWGKLPGNPTLYFEWIGLEDRPDRIEPKLLLGGEIAPRWHWGVNLVAELELGEEHEHEYQLTGGVSYSAVDSVLSLGLEVTAAVSDVDGARGDFGGTESVLLGPSVQWRALPQVTLNVAPLAGLTDDSPHAQIWVNFGFEF